MYQDYLLKAKKILENLNIKTKDINSKEEIKNSKSFVATLKPSEKIKIK